YARFGFILPEHPVSMIAIGMLGIALGAIAWWLMITSLFAKLGTMINVRRIGLLNRLIGIIVLCLAAIGIASALLTLYFPGLLC
ncbi:MAG: LysE family translocator, partial [bacterium]|nr:LysE family translocator [bacterium]